MHSIKLKSSKALSNASDDGLVDSDPDDGAKEIKHYKSKTKDKKNEKHSKKSTSDNGDVEKIVTQDNAADDISMQSATSNSSKAVLNASDSGLTDSNSDDGEKKRKHKTSKSKRKKNKKRSKKATAEDCDDYKIITRDDVADDTSMHSIKSKSSTAASTAASTTNDGGLVDNDPDDDSKKIEHEPSSSNHDKPKKCSKKANTGKTQDSDDCNKQSDTNDIDSSKSKLTKSPTSSKKGQL